MINFNNMHKTEMITDETQDAQWTIVGNGVIGDVYHTTFLECSERFIPTYCGAWYTRS